MGISRRRFLQASAAALSSVALANCRPTLTDPKGGNGSTPGKLHIYTWADYTDDELTKLFTEKTGIEVIVDIYDSNEQMLAKILAGGGDAYSLIYPSDYMVNQMIDMDLLSQLDKSQLVGTDQLLEKWQNPLYDPENTHSIPFSWGTTGLLYNSAKLKKAPKDWGYLWEEQKSLAKRITLLEDVRETMGAVLRSLDYSYNSTNPTEIEAAYKKLVELKPAIASFKSFGWQDQLLGGDLLLVMSYSTDAISVTRENADFEYVIPASGSSVWTDTLVIPKSAPNPEAAYAWINFILEPEISAQAVERLFFATPNSAAFDLLPKPLQENDDLFPPPEVLAKCEGIAPLGAATDVYDRYWTELTSA
ncbi:MAG: spermidine/putrescine ABC transporter substrate-binding protein [Cyanothece sp. SIO1E1]|nr:spermidine/putrescine ABC transporter substrate-binding protein [Cyanothece sp. SIO1E1]